MLEMCTLGTGGTLPLPTRALSSLYIRVNGRAMLIDCGEGTQVGIRRLGWGFRCLDGALLTHFHGDHCTGLAGLLLSLEKAGRDEPFFLYGPAGLKRVVEGLCVIVPKLSYPVILQEYETRGMAFELIGLQIRAFPVSHGIPCYGFRMELPRKPAFDPDKARAMGIPVTAWKRLQEGESVRVGLRKIAPESVQGAARRGIRFVYATDTRPCETIEKYTPDADLLILEGMYDEEEDRPLAVKNHHMMFSEAAEIARKAGVPRLVLTHFSTRIENPEAGLAACRDIFPNTWAAHDGMRMTLRYPKGDEPAEILRSDGWGCGLTAEASDAEGEHTR